MVRTELILCAIVIAAACGGGGTQSSPCNGSSCAAPSVGAASSLIDGLIEALTKAKCEVSSAATWPRDEAGDLLQAGEKARIYDFVIVGAGSAGSVVATRLSENPNLEVLVVESGDDPPMESEIFTLSATLHHTKYMRSDFSEPNSECCQAMRDGQCYWPTGKMIGGTGGCNGNIFLLGNRENFDRWQALGNLGWSWDEVRHLYERATVGGDLTINYFDEPPAFAEFAQIILNATDELGVPRLASLDDDGTRVGYTHKIPATIERGRRMSTGKTYLASKASVRPNLHVIKNALATRIRLSPQRRAIGVDVVLQGRYKVTVRARKEVVVAAGSLYSPTLLMRSGIGPRRHLQELRIPVAKELDVGENLIDHGMMPLLLKFGRDLELPAGAGAPAPGQQQGVFDYLLHQSGPLASDFSLMGFIDSTANSSSLYPDVHMVAHRILPKGLMDSLRFLMIKDELIAGVERQVGNSDVLSIFGSLLKPRSRGRVRLRSTDPLAGPRIFSGYARDDADKAALLRFVRFVQRLAATDSFRRYGLQLIHVPIEECDRLAYDTDAYWLCFVRYWYLGAWHPVGTCRMGPPRQKGAVVDERLRVHGVRGLRVIDASVMPEITSGNTNGPTVIVAEKGALMIKEDWNYI